MVGVPGTYALAAAASESGRPDVAVLLERDAEMLATDGTAA
jgi:hypothetical protein